MSRRLFRSGLLLALFFASEVWALGLGDIRLDSALNEPLRAEIDLLSATPEELESLRISLASSETFERYGIDRPLYLTTLQFRVTNSGGGSVVSVTSPEPITEPFVTFLVEANWSRGRLLREYTVLLDPPTFAPAPSTPTREEVAAPQQRSQSDRGRIERQAAPAPTPRARPQQSAPSFDTTAGDDYAVQRGDTLWRIAERVRPDNRLSMNQTMLAIYEANPDAFAGNINVLRANARLRIPSADEIFRISRRSALSEIQRHNQAWSGAAPATQTTLTLVPPDSDQAPYQGAPSSDTAAGAAASAESADRIRRLEQQVAEQESLLEIRDNELAQLRSELARMREERAAAGADMPADAAPDMPADSGDVVADDMADDMADNMADDTAAGDEIFVDDEPADSAADDAAAAADDAADTTQPAQPAPRVTTPPRQEQGLVDTIIAALTGIWGLIGLAVLLVIGVLAWFAKRASGDDESESTGVWDALDADDDVDSESVASTERLRAMAREDDASIVVVEQQQDTDTIANETLELPDDDAAAEPAPATDETAETGESVSLEDTFSSETAINLDQSDPVAEADFHMAYGLYDQAADLINGALAVEPERTDLMAKLCEIYFVWGNRDAFVDAAGRLKAALGDSAGGDWDKIVIMGQQIAADHELFSNVSAGGATRAVDLDFESAGDEDAALDIDFEAGGPDGAVSDVIDFGADDAPAESDDGLDFSFGDDDEDTSASITREMPGAGGSDDEATVETPALDVGDEDDDATAETPTIEAPAADDTVESPTIEQPLDPTAELQSPDEEDRASDATAEIDLDDLGLDLDSLAGDLGGDDTGILEEADDDATHSDLGDSLAETGRNEALPEEDAGETDVNVKVDEDLLDATGQTQVLPDDFTIETTSDAEADLGDEDATMLAPGLGGGNDDPDFDFAKTEALPEGSYDGDETAESPNLAGSTDMDLDLDDLTAALKLSESGDTVEQQRDDATVEQPRPDGDDLDFDLGLGDEESTQALGPDDVSDDLQEARTMTEVGTKLDLARAYVDMGDPGGARNILEEVLEEGDESQRQQAQQLLDSLPG